MDDLQERVQIVRNIFKEQVFNVDDYVEHLNIHQFLVEKGNTRSSVGDLIFDIKGGVKTILFQVSPLPSNLTVVSKSGEIDNGKIIIEGKEINQWKDLEVFIN
ncbi:hypothetical protein [Salinivibrio kushneri]|uniref:hypothetical protein n=1 Tax=Salinivibrio kushneri TaxID=1908198 RepID=UPI0022B4D411|nr:hypothetical protein [Salinivibrio kushneri]WBA11421.1 hypothetical protein O4546_11560 [Salinivibrio kushneri]